VEDDHEEEERGNDFPQFPGDEVGDFSHGLRTPSGNRSRCRQSSSRPRSFAAGPSTASADEMISSKAHSMAQGNSCIPNSLQNQILARPVTEAETVQVWAVAPSSRQEAWVASELEAKAGSSPAGPAILCINHIVAAMESVRLGGLFGRF
jgi:hypothetical protein